LRRHYPLRRPRADENDKPAALVLDRDSAVRLIDAPGEPADAIPRKRGPVNVDRRDVPADPFAAGAIVDRTCRPQ
jgi:hypothetical protein